MDTAQPGGGVPIDSRGSLDPVDDERLRVDGDGKVVSGSPALRCRHSGSVLPVTHGAKRAPLLLGNVPTGGGALR